MSEDTDTTESRTAASAGDDRFEVKWKKKDSGSRTPPPETPGEESPDVATLQRELEEARARITDLQDKWHRAAADVANLRRRTEQERGDMEKFASMLLV